MIAAAIVSLAKENFFRIALSSLVSVAVARSLGVNGFGELNYILSVVAILSAISEGGLLKRVKFLFGNGKNRLSLLRTATVLIFTQSCIVLFLFYSLGLWLGFLQVDGQLWILGIATIGVLLQFRGTYKVFLEAEMFIKETVNDRLVSFLCSAFSKLGCASLGLSLPFFVIANLISPIVELFLYKRRLRKETNDKIIPQVDKSDLLKLLLIVGPLLLNALSTMIFMRIDQIMITRMVSTHENGLYSLSARLSEMWNFIPTALAIVFFRDIKRNLDGEGIAIEDPQSRTFLLRYFSLNVYAVAFIAGVIFVSTPLFVPLVFGREFSDAVPVIRIHLFSLIFVAIGLARQQVFLARNMLWFPAFSAVFAAVVNVLLNLLWIPKWGGVGAAYATLVSYSLTSYFSTLAMRGGLNLFLIQTAGSLVPYFLVRSRDT